MATKQELAERAVSLSEQLGETVELDDDATHSDLSALVRELEAKVRDKQEPDLLRTAPPPAPAPVDVSGKWKIAPGKAVHCGRGQLKEGEPIRKTDFDEKTLQRLATIGAITKD